MLEQNHFTIKNKTKCEYVEKFKPKGNYYTKQIECRELHGKMFGKFVKFIKLF